MIRRKLGKRGTTAVEFALVLMPLMLLLFGILEFGRLLWTKAAFQQTAMSVARCMGVKQPACATGTNVDTAKATTYALSLATSFHVPLPASALALSASGTCGGQGGFSRVVITSTFHVVVPLIQPFIGTAGDLGTIACFPNQV
ncbi:TadE/TadG family type IV pilus assembly protein [Glacieibacterium sp.]|uniref:TadE/TadG family type IV pilus assembly protein n=1 Tax=Glacieibacterium sp. TaxID=2860237 RepID=UPI003AFFF5BE